MTARSPYIVGRTYDWTFFLAPPIVALLLGFTISSTPLTDGDFHLAGAERTAAGLAIGALIHAHLVAVFLRSHGNTGIFRRHPWRFTAIPVALLVAIVVSPWIAVAATVVATFWDVWHSGAQTFGFVRIYERNAGNGTDVGRRLDYWLNQIIYAGPMLAGATLMDHVDSFGDFSAVGSAFLGTVPAHVSAHSRLLTWSVVVGGGAFIAVYLAYQWLLRARGYRVSVLKVWLLVSTAVCSVAAWGFNSWGEAFFIMNFFHAVQYLGLVWVSERKQMLSRLRLPDSPMGRRLGATAFLGGVGIYGVGAELLDSDFTVLWAITIVVSLMHFWYDAFVWSVKRRDV